MELGETMLTVSSIRKRFVEAYIRRPDNDHTLDIIGSSFVADEPAIFGTVDEDYVRRELDWYLSQSSNIYDMEPPIPTMWKNIAGKNGHVNSNYGRLVFGDGNFDNAVKELKENPDSRRSIISYVDQFSYADRTRNGCNDMVCTMFTQHRRLNDEELIYMVYMRSNDAVFGYKNDLAWHKYLADKMCKELNLERFYIFWNAGSLHVYPRHFHLVQQCL